MQTIEWLPNFIATPVDAIYSINPILHRSWWHGTLQCNKAISDYLKMCGFPPSPSAFYGVVIKDDPFMEGADGGQDCPGGGCER